MLKLSTKARSAPSGALLALLIAVGLAGQAEAKDAVRARVPDAGGGMVTENGAFHVPGTYAIGTLKIQYMIVGNQFPTDSPLKEFELCLDVLQGKGKPYTAYPANVYLEQIGSPDLVLTPPESTLTFAEADVGTVEMPGKESCVTIGVSVPAEVAGDPDFQEDGTELVANIQISTDKKTHLDTVTTVKIHLTLVHPAENGACLVPLHTIANMDLNSNLSASGVPLSFNVQNNNLSSNPTDFRHVVALVNTCNEEKTIDLNTAINENFGLQSAEAVRTTTANQEFVDIDALLGAGLDPDAFDSQETALCLKGVSVPGMQTFIVAERFRIASPGTARFPGSVAASKGRELADWFYDNFTYDAHDHAPASACATLALSTDADPNQGEVDLPVTQVSYNGGSSPPPTEFPPSP